jgi:hypothetical protein
MWASSSLIRSKAAVCIGGRVRSLICIKASSRRAKETAEGLSGGRMAAGMKGISRMVSNAVWVSSTVRPEPNSMKGAGRMACLTVRAFNTLTTANAMKAISRRTSFMARECSIRMTQSSMECGRIMSYRS